MLCLHTHTILVSYKHAYTIQIVLFLHNLCLPIEQLGAELGALAISHLEEVTDDGIAAMAKAKTSAVLLPTTAYILR